MTKKITLELDADELAWLVDGMSCNMNYMPNPDFEAVDSDDADHYREAQSLAMKIQDALDKARGRSDG